MQRGIAAAAWLLSSACTFVGDGGTDQGPSLAEPDIEPQPAADGGGPAPEPEPNPEPEPDPTGAADDSGTPPDDPPHDPGKLPPPEDPPAGTSDDDGGTGDMEPPVETCPETYEELLWAQDATASGPIEMLPAVDADGEPLVAVSFQAESGEVEFTLDLPCAGDYYVHGLLWDAAPGAYASGDPDSLYVSTGGPEFVWRYGCQTGGSSIALTWQPLQRLDAQPCDTTPITLSAPSGGAYSLTIRNREAGGNLPYVAGIGAIVVSMDPYLDPHDLYDPFA